MFLFPILALLCVNSMQASAAPVSPTGMVGSGTCSTTSTFTLALSNSDGKTPCDLVSVIGQPCGNTPVTSDNTLPYHASSTSCACNSVAYSVASACAACQSNTLVLPLDSYSDWLSSCSASQMALQWPFQESQFSTPIPQWAFIELPSVNSTWDANAALQNSSTPADLPGSSPGSDAAHNSTASTAILASTIAGGVLFGIGLLVMVVVIWRNRQRLRLDQLGVRRRRRRRAVKHTPLQVQPPLNY